MKYFALTFVLLMLSISAAAQHTAAKIISGPAFAISAEDEALGIGGTMKVAANIDDSGKVTRAAVYVGPMWPCSSVDIDKRVVSIMRAAESLVKTYKFAPATENGKPVDSAVGISLPIGKPIPKIAAQVMPASQRPVPKQITGGIVNGKAKSLPKPPYPAEARAARVSGTVTVQVLIDEDGNVASAQAIEGPVLLHFASRWAACQAKFSPTQLQGVPVKVSGVIVYNFVP